MLVLLTKEYKSVDSLDANGYAVFDITPFYAQSGGQVGDIGSIEIDGKETVKVADTQKPLEKLYLHKISVVGAVLKKGKPLL